MNVWKDVVWADLETLDVLKETIERIVCIRILGCLGETVTALAACSVVP